MPNPDVGLDRFEEMAEVKRTIGVRKGRGDEEGSRWGGHKGSD